MISGISANRGPVSKPPQSFSSLFRDALFGLLMAAGASGSVGGTNLEEPMAHTAFASQIEALNVDHRLIGNKLAQAERQKLLA